MLESMPWFSFAEENCTMTYRRRNLIAIFVVARTAIVVVAAGVIVVAVRIVIVALHSKGKHHAWARRTDRPPEAKTKPFD